ncbi:MAG: hypothetical protein OEY14_15810 [Myxococcales bacterium]|nr:hypothetical protein [Myxococcales bacterium]
MPSGQPDQQEERSDEAEDPLLDEAWARLEAEWGAPQAHRRFVALCASLGRLAEAGARYRVVRMGDPERREQAEEGIEIVLEHAMRSLSQIRTEPSRRGVERAQLLALLIGSAFVFTALWLLLR